MMNMQSIMKQAQKMQKDMEKKQAELAAKDFTASSVQDLVTATLSGDRKVKAIQFNPAVVDPEDLETLADMTAQAINKALEQIDQETQRNMGALAGKLPF
ncbi:YbaB/EbfC family nucleoid-associated protein [Streptococcus sp. 10F2]